MKRIKKPISILLVFMMIVSLFAVVPITASAAVGDFVPETEYLTFTAEEAGSSVTLNYANGTLKYNIDNSDWVDYTKGAQITLKNAGDSVRFRGKDTTFNEYNHVSIGGKVACSGNVMSLRLDDTGKVQGLSNGCFEYMFNGCTGLTAAPKLPETTLATSCYDSMFYGCKSLTTAPELPAKMLESYCYSSMFSGCESLTTAPELPATTLAVRCYNYMFSGCISLTTAPALPATTLADYCYYGMFYGCTSLTTAPELPATTLVTNCYSSMFNGCEKIKLSTTQTAEYSIPYSVPSGGNGTATATNALNNMFANTGGTFTGKPTINTTYYMYVSKCTVTYKTATWNGNEVVIDSADTNNYTVVTSETASWSNGTYVVDADVTITGRIGVGGNVNLILCDGATLTATQGIHVSRGNTLNIFAQSFGDSAGALKVTSGGGANAGIGSNSYENCGNITINGGNLQVVGGNMSAGIGGGNLKAGGTITINAGDVTATGGNPDNVYGNPHGGAGIGGGSNGGGGAGNVAIHGGHVKATATGNNSPAAVGGGYAKGAEGTVTITDGLVVLAGSNASSAKPCFDYPTHRTIYVEIWEHDHSELSYTTSGNVLTAECSSDGCNFINHEISVKLNTPNKSYDETAYSEAYFSSDSVAHNAAEEFNAATGLNISLDNIEYYQDGTKLSSAPVEVGSYTAKLTVVVNGSEHTISDDFKIIEAHIHDGINFKFWEKTDSLPTTAGNYYLLYDVTLSGTWTVPAGETNLCLAGHTIRQSGSGSVILLNNSNKKLTVYDDGTTGTITGGNTNSEGGGVKITAGTFTLKGGNIEGNVASNGGGVSVSGQSSYFTMAGGTIRYNSGYGNTGGVLLVSTDNFTMTGGEIRYNVGKNFGGIGISNAHPNMSGTSVVKDNVVFNDTSASNTKITKTESGYTIASGGTPCDIKDATANGLKINVTGAFESGAQIGIFNNDQTAEFTSGFDTNNPDGAPADYFFSNDSNRLVMLSANKEAQLVEYFTVIWKNEDGTVLETDEKVAYGTTPEYNGTTPEKAEDAENTYTFSGWTDGTNTYGASDTLPAVTGDITYTATFAAENKAVKNVIALINALPAAAEIIAADKAQIEAARAAYEALNGDQKALISTETLDKLTAAEAALAAAEKLFAAHSVTLGGNIGVNFFINSKTVDFANADTAVVKFTWDYGKYNEEVNLKELTLDANGYYKASVDVVAAQIAHKIHAEVYLNGEKLEQTDDYSVQDYAEAVYDNPAKYDSEKPEQLKALAKALLNYGANAQTVFDSALIEKPALANANVGNNGYADVTAEQIGAAINGTASDLNAIATRLGAKYFTSSLIYLSKNTLRIYFTPTSYPGEIPNANAYDGSKSDHYYYVDHANIPAAELDDQQTFNVNGTTFTFSALDYAKAVVESTKMDDDQKNLAKSLYLYNQAANDYFV